MSAMGAVWLRLRAELRQQWRAWLALAVLLGVIGGIALTAAAGARRTDTAYPRFLRQSNAADLLVSGPRDARLVAVAPGLTLAPLDWWEAPGRVLEAAAGRGVEAFVVDSYHAEARLLAVLRRAALVVAIDDLADRPLAVDVVVNGAWHAERLAYRVEPETRRLLGPRYALLERAFAEAMPRAVSERVERVLVTLGGATPRAACGPRWWTSASTTGSPICSARSASRSSASSTGSWRAARRSPSGTSPR